MKTLLKGEWPLLLVLAAPFVFLASVWPQIPDRVPVIIAPGMTDKALGMLLMPCVATALCVHCLWLCRHDPKVASMDGDTRIHVAKVLHKANLAMAALFSTVSIAVALVALGHQDAVTHALSTGIPLCYLMLGNWMSKLPPNHTLGIRSRWSLASPMIWRRTHRFFGKLRVTSCLALLAWLALSHWKTNGAAPAVFFGCAVLATLVLSAAAAHLYTFVLWRKTQGSTVTAEAGNA